MENLEVKILPGGKAVARRIDGLPLTVKDRTAARQIADKLREKQRGITIADVLRNFPGAWVVQRPTNEPKPSCCSHCAKDSIPEWRRAGKIVQIMGPNENPYWACHYCGRRCNQKIGSKKTTRGSRNESR